MNPEKCMENLRHDVNNGGIEEDSFSVICYIAMANKAIRSLRDKVEDGTEAKFATDFLALCRESGSDALKYIARG